MQAIILAAGVGSRLEAAHRGAPKCLAEVGGKTILARQVDALRGIGVDNVVVVTGYEAELVEDALRGQDATFIHNPAFRTTNVLGSWLVGSAKLMGDHLYMHGDTVFEPELLRRALRGVHGSVVLTIDRHRCGAEEMKVCVDGPWVTEVSKEIQAEAAFGEFTGVMFVSGKILPVLRDLAWAVSARVGGERSFFEAVLQDLIRRDGHAVGWVDVSDLRWCEIDFPEDLVAARAMFGDGR